MSLLDDLISGVTGNVDGTAQAGFGILGWVFWIVVLAGLTFAGFLAFRWFYGKTAYEGEKPIAPYLMVWMGKYGSIEGNLSHNDSFDDELMENLERHSELKMFPDIIKHQVRQKQINLYNFKITDEGDVTDDLDRKVRIISSMDLTALNVAFEEQKGRRNPLSIMTREKRRVVVFYHTSKKIEIVNEDGHTEEWWVVSPVPMTEAKQHIGFDSNAIQGTPQHWIEVFKLEGGKALASIASLSPILSEAIQKFQHVKAERDEFSRLYDETFIRLEDANLDKSNLKHLLSQKQYVEYGEKEHLEKSPMNFGWLIGCAVITFIMVKLMPEILPPTIDLEIAQILGMGISVAVIGLVWKWYTDSQKTMEEKVSEQ